ncbi:class I SAM-dependent methyltransferase [Actinomadura kijaniata]|uniref:class I SAM-dependent methyltransferase n=1 Tax=Actinomadura kijaniata TaxID=46161 RepID=UPI0008304FCE|nr:class I SAM-dependent methyltransferase [Actinomadura kijaniata]
MDPMTAAFDALADDYDDVHHDAVARALTEAVRPAPDALVADVACGTGAVALILARTRPATAAPVLAIDLSPAMVARGRERGAGLPVDWRVGDAVPLPVPDASLDAILCASSLHFLGAAALADWRRALRPGGRVGFTLPPAAHFHPSGTFAALVAEDLPLPRTPADAVTLTHAAGFTDTTATLADTGTRPTIVTTAVNP